MNRTLLDVGAAAAAVVSFFLNTKSLTEMTSTVA